MLIIFVHPPEHLAPHFVAGYPATFFKITITKEKIMFGFGDKNKVHKVTIANTGETFEVTGKINLLQAAKNAGIEWPCDCKVGSCGTCRAVLKEGKVKELADFAYTLDGDMLKEGYILACQSSLKSDITVELDKSQKAVEATKM